MNERYNASQFSKQYSERTEKNLVYITKTQERMEKVKNFKGELLKAYTNSLSTINVLVEQIRAEAKSISPGNNSRIKEIKSKLFSTASEIEECKLKVL